MKRLFSITCVVMGWIFLLPSHASASIAASHIPYCQEDSGKCCASKATAEKTMHRLTIGGYGEAVYKYNFFSDNIFRYSRAESYKDSKGHGQVDLPHAVIMMGYDFGHGWTMGTEIEFEHGGVEAAVEKETEETGEFEQEIERGG